MILIEWIQMETGSSPSYTFNSACSIIKVETNIRGPYIFVKYHANHRNLNQQNTQKKKEKGINEIVECIVWNLNSKPSHRDLEHYYSFYTKQTNKNGSSGRI